MASETTTSNRRKNVFEQRNRNHPKSPPMRKERLRLEAEQRAQERSVRTTAEQLELIATRRGESKREVARLASKSTP